MKSRTNSWPASQAAGAVAVWAPLSMRTFRFLYGAASSVQTTLASPPPTGNASFHFASASMTQRLNSSQVTSARSS